MSKPIIPVLKKWPALYDSYYIFESVAAVDYDPYLQRVTCKVTLSINYVIMKEYVGGTSRELEMWEQQQRFLKAANQPMTRSFSVQPNSRGQMVATLLANPPGSS
jgi:hypothetical protein